jgi:hypothetical protein
VFVVSRDTEKFGNEEYMLARTGITGAAIFCQVFKRLQASLVFVKIFVRWGATSIFLGIDTGGGIFGGCLAFDAFASRAAFIRERPASNFFMLTFYVIRLGSSTI